MNGPTQKATGGFTVVGCLFMVMWLLCVVGAVIGAWYNSASAVEDMGLSRHEFDFYRVEKVEAPK
jgi:uncharacterized membrane protein